jgi:hypothetical protein
MARRPHLPRQQRCRERPARYRARPQRLGPSSAPIVGGARAAAVYTLPSSTTSTACLADVLRRIADHPVSRLYELSSLELGKVRAAGAVAARLSLATAVAGDLLLAYDTQ